MGRARGVGNVDNGLACGLLGYFSIRFDLYMIDIVICRIQYNSKMG